MINIGTTGWSYNFWRKDFYPRGTKDLLEYYSKNSSITEVNSTFYQIPSEKTIERWKKVTPDKFKFTIKMLKDLTHSRAEEVNISLLRNFCQPLLKLDEKLDGILIQFPYSFDFNDQNGKYLNELIMSIEDLIPTNLFIEIRNPTWTKNLISTQNSSKNLYYVLTSKLQYLNLKPEQDINYVRILGSHKEFPDRLLGTKRIIRDDKLLDFAKNLILTLKNKETRIYVNNRFSGNGAIDARTLHKIFSNMGLEVSGFAPEKTLEDFF